jgi:hypothetical protein
VPALDRAEEGGGAAEHEAVDALRCLQCQCHSDHAAERQPAERDAVELERVEQLDQAVSDGLDGDGRVGDRRAAVAREVEANDLEIVCERGSWRSQSSQVVPRELASTSGGLRSRPVDPVCELHVPSER